MSVQNNGALGAHVATGASTAQSLGVQMSAGLATVSGTFVGTVQIEISVDGTNFAITGSALTAPGSVAIPQAARKVRSNCTAWTSGTITAVAGWVNET